MGCAFRHLRKYSKDSSYSYTLGVYPTIELLRAKPELVLCIIAHSKFSFSDGFEKIKKYCRRYTIRYTCNDKLMSRLSPKNNCYLIGVFKKYNSLLDDNDNHLVLVNPRNAGNLGTILRCALAFGCSNIGIITPAADIFSPEVIRSSMGAIFNVNIQLFCDFHSYQGLFQHHNLFLFMISGSSSLRSVTFQRPYSLVFGNESSGLPDDYSTKGITIRISQSDKVDSLNLALSCSIVLHHLYCQNT